MWVMPTKELAENYSKEKYSKFIKSTRILDRLLNSKQITGDSSDSILSKFFKNGSWICFGGANSENSLSSRSIKWVFCDELSGFPNSIGSHGSPLKLVRARTQSFIHSGRKIIMTSTPNLKGRCQISNLLDDPDTKRFEYRVKCPECDKYICLKWEQVKFNADNPAETGYYECQKCKKDIKLDQRKNKIVGTGYWHDLHPEKSAYRVGFHVNFLVSPFQTISEALRQYADAMRNGEDQLKTFYNVVLGLPYEPESSSVKHNNLYMRREDYLDHHGNPVDVPNTPSGTPLILTMGADVQVDRIECEIVGHCQDGRTVSVGYHRLYGDPSDIDNPQKNTVWDQLNDLMEKEYTSAHGIKMRVDGCCIDTGGLHTRQTYKFINQSYFKNIWGIKGKEGDRPIVSHSTMKKSGRDRPVKLFIVGTDSAKALVYSRLQVDDRNKPGYCHFPKGEGYEIYDDKHFKHMTCEYLDTVYVKGKPVSRWKKPSHLPNEPLDCRVYALAALEILNPSWKGLEKRVMERAAAGGKWEWLKTKAELKKEAQQEKEKKPKKKLRRPRNSYMNSWRF